MDRLAQALDRPTRGRTPVVDILAPPAAPNPADTLASLLPDVHAHRGYSEEQLALLRNHAKAKRTKTMLETQAKALVRPIAAMLEQIIELKAEEGIATGDWDALVDDDSTFRLQPYEHRRVYPRYREDLETDQPYTVEDVCTALVGAGFGELVIERPDDKAYNALVADRVKRWRQIVGETGGRKIDGVFVDLDGTPLRDFEAADDPAADILALPVALRRVVEPVEQLDIRYRRTDNPDAPAQPSAPETAAEHSADG